MDNMPKKKIYKKWWFWVIAIIIIGGIGSSGDKDKKTTDNSKPVTTQEQTKKEEPKKEEPKKEEFDFSKAELTKENVAKAVYGVLEKEKVVSVDLKTENGKNIIDITYNPGDVLNEKSFLKVTAGYGAEAMEVLFKNPKVDKVWFWTQTEMTDAKGNTSKQNIVNVALSKENAKDINWSKFKDMVKSDYNAMFNIADEKFIHPSILKNLN